MGRFKLRGKVGRYLLVALGVLVLVGALVAIKFAQISSLMAFGEEAEAMGPPPESVSTAVSKEQPWERTLQAVGTIASVESVTIRNEVPGVVEEIHFDSGDKVEADAPLLRLDAKIESSQLAAARARLSAARSDFQRSRQLLERGAFARAQFEEAQAAYEVARGELQALEAQVGQKIVRAPFAGRLGIRTISLGQFLEPGTPITVLDAVGEAFVDFALPQQDLRQVAVGNPIRVTMREGGETREGRVAAISPTVNPITRSLELRAHLADPSEQLRPGMFVDVEVVLPAQRSVVAIPQTAVVHAPYGDSVFVVEEKEPGSPGMSQTPDGREVKIARQQFVRLGASRGDFVEVVEGLAGGQEVVTAGAFKLRNLAPVVISEEQPAPKLNPRPENR